MAQVGTTSVVPLRLGSLTYPRTRVALEDMLTLLKCCLCQEVALDPVYLGRCPHIFCIPCLEPHTGGMCPVAACGIPAPVRDAQVHKPLQQIVRNLYRIKRQLLKDELPEKVAEVLTASEPDSEVDDDTGGILADATNSSRPSAPVKKSTTGRKRPSEPLPSDLQQRSSVSKRAAVGQVNPHSALAEDLKSRPAEVKRPSRPKASGDSKPRQSNSKRSSNAEVKKKARSSKEHNYRTSMDISAKPAMEKRNKKGETPLHASAVSGDLLSVQRHLANGADPNTTDNAGWTPLHEAVAAGNANMVQVLLKAGAAPNIHATHENLTPLHEAAQSGLVQIVQLLIEYGGDKTARNCKGLTARDMALNDATRDAIDNSELVHKTANVASSVAQEQIRASSIVLACCNLSDAEYQKVNTAALHLGVRSISSKVTEQTTHCLFNAKIVESSFLFAHIVGSETVNYEWILQSQSMKRLVDTEPFRVQCPAAVTVEGRERALENRRKKQLGLFTGIHFYLCGGFDLPGMSKSELVKLITLGGGRTVTREPDPEFIPENEQTVGQHAEPGSSLAATSHVLVYQEGGRREPLLKYNMAHIKTLPTSWLLRCCKHYLLADPHLAP